MIAELGHFALILAFVVAVLQSGLPMWGAARDDARLIGLAKPLAKAQVVLLALAFGALMNGFITSDFSLRVVWSNSHTLKPLLYKITGTWGNHEGSMLLWVLILALFGAAAAVWGNGLPARLHARVLSVQAMIGAAFLAFILFTSNPFERLSPAPFNGQDLNPLLQDPGLAFHPPFLYLGYVGLSMAFSFAVAALIEGRVDASWARWVRPWTLAAWLFLTIGIALGSWWAYYELGWGGFWFWDPVENASFMPWLLAGALLHSSIVVEKREALKSWTILLAILAFGFSLIGTFIVRSGVLTSVHAFANDPERGVFILGILGVFIGGALTLFALRASRLEARGVFSIVSRESALVLNNILLAVAALVVFVGTIWPLVIELLSRGERKISVGAPFFDAAFTPLMVILILLLPVGAILPWKRARLGQASRPLAGALALALAGGGLALVLQTGRGALGPAGLALGLWLVGGAATDLWMRTGRGGFAARLQRLGRVPRAEWGKAVAHSGFGITVLAISGLMAWQVEDIRIARQGQPFQVADLTITLDAVDAIQGPNYTAQRGSLTVARGDRVLAVLTPEKRQYPVAGMPTTEAAITSSPWRDIYLVLGDAQADGNGWTVRTFVKPLAMWIWAGAIIMALGAFLSLTDRRHRVAAGARAAGPSPGASPPSAPVVQG